MATRPKYTKHVKKNPDGPGFVGEVKHGNEVVSRGVRSTKDQAERFNDREAAVDKHVVAGTKPKSRKHKK